MLLRCKWSPSNWNWFSLTTKVQQMSTVNPMTTVHPNMERYVLIIAPRPYSVQWCPFWFPLIPSFSSETIFVSHFSPLHVSSLFQIYFLFFYLNRTREKYSSYYCLDMARCFHRTHETHSSSHCWLDLVRCLVHDVRCCYCEVYSRRRLPVGFMHCELHWTKMVSCVTK